MQQNLSLGTGTIRKLPGLLQRNHIASIFLVTGKRSFESCGAKAVMERLLKGKPWTRFSDFEENPRLEDVMKGITEIRKGSYDAVVAVGGGTVIDMAKLVNIFSLQEGEPLEYIQGRRKIDTNGRLMIAIPTTAGSGSESTHFAVVYIGEEKYSVASQHILPRYAIVDPVFCMSLPQSITASTGMDALCQGIESYWSVNSTATSRKYARKAVQLSYRSLRKAVLAPDKAARKVMSLAANLAGRAINISKTTAPHALSYFLTKKHNLPHGHAAAVFLPDFIVFNSAVSDIDLIDKRGVSFVRKRVDDIVKMLGEKSPEAAKGRIRELIREIGMETDLRKIIKDEEELNDLVRSVNIERLANNPRRITEHQLTKMVKIVCSVES